jgi:hypothetical protein
MMSEQQQKFYWGHNPDNGKAIYLTGEEFLRELKPLIVGPVRSMQESDGDLLMSEFQKLTTGCWRIDNAISSLDRLKGEDNNE